MSSKPQASKVVQAAHRLEQKWGKTLLEAEGFTAIPTIILRRQQALGLDPLDLNIIMVLVSFWWEAGKRPFPSKELLASVLGCDQSTVRRRLQRLEAGKLIKRVPRRHEKGGNKSNEYDFGPLIKAVHPYAVAAIKEKEKRKKDEVAKVAKKGKPELASMTQSKATT